MKTRVKAQFIIEGKDINFKPEEVTMLLQVKRSLQRKIGEIMKVRGDNIVRAPYSSWRIETDYHETYYCDEQIRELLKVLEGKEKLICQIYEQYEVDIYFMIVYEVEGDIFPVFDLDNKFIKYLSSINAGMRFDPYYMSGCDE